MNDHICPEHQRMIEAVQTIALMQTKQETTCNAHMGDVREDLQQVLELCKHLDKAIRGNGTPGLNSRVAMIERLIAILGAVLLPVAGRVIFLWLTGDKI